MKSLDPPSEQLQYIINLLTQGKLQRTLSESSKMLEQFPKSAVLCNIVGVSNAGLMQFDAAIDFYKRALKIKPNYAEAYFNLGHAFKSEGDLEGAVGSYKQALKLKPDYAEAYNNIGNALKDKGDLREAIVSYKQAINIKPNYANAYNNMGNTLKDKGDLEAAVDSYKQALKIKPDYAKIYYNMGISLKDKGNPEEALDSFKQALKIKPDYADAKSNLIALLTSYTPQKESLNPIVIVNEEIRKIDIKDTTSKIISDEHVINIVSRSENYISGHDLKLSIPISQAFRRNSVSLNCDRHKSIFDKHDIIPEFCFGCYKVQVEPRSIIELIKLFIVFDQLELNENNTRKCMVELRPEISGFYKGLIFCSGLKQANQIAEHLNIILKQSIGLGLSSKVKRGCSEYPISFPNYKEINNSGPQLMNYKEEWKAIEEAHDRKKAEYAKEIKKTSLSGINLSDILIIRKWIDYARGIGDPTADLLSKNTLYYQDIYDIAKARLDKFNFSY